MARFVVNGVEYNVERAGAGPPLVLLHGFTGSAATWTPFRSAFGEFATFAVDLLGHGASDAPADPARYRMERTIDDLATLLDCLGVARAAWLGYSLGGRVALSLAVAYPERVAALVLESASPGIADPVARAARARDDEALADRLESEGIEPFVAHWERLPLFASQARLPDATRAALRRQRLANAPRGLANSLRGVGQGAQPPLHDRLSELAVPVLLVAGEEDEKFRWLAREMAVALPVAEVACIAGAGHATHLEQPHAFARVVQDFLQRQEIH